MPLILKSKSVRHWLFKVCTAAVGASVISGGGTENSMRAAETAPVVSISSGQLKGIAVKSGAEFLGIPFAQPPVSELRWRAPEPPKPWSGVRDAEAFGAPCTQTVQGDWNQHDAETSKEDCLYLNVMTPQWPPKEPLPVMFWLHGGGNNGGTASSALYKDGTLYAHGVVLVTVNYRLGIFGFFSHPELTKESAHRSSGNYGLLDQIAALRWVHDNIAKFGGDPKNVTAFGQSAGGFDINLLMTSPLAKGLFQKAILQSGTLPTGLPSLSEMEKNDEKWAASLKAPEGQGGIKYLRGLATENILKAVERPEGPGIPRVPIVPVIDGWVLSKPPGDIFAAGEEAGVPMIIGTNSREFEWKATAEESRKRLEGFYEKLAPKALQAYGLADGGEGKTDPLYGPVAGQISADLQFRCPATTQAIWHNATHHPVYEYQLERAIPGHEAEGAPHSNDLVYVFGYYPKTGNIGGVFGETDYKLADLVEKYWTNFARTGNPNGPDLPKWPEFDGTQAFIRFTEDGQVVADAGLRREQCDVYREVLKQRMAH